MKINAILRALGVTYYRWHLQIHHCKSVKKLVFSVAFNYF